MTIQQVIDTTTQPSKRKLYVKSAKIIEEQQLLEKLDNIPKVRKSFLKNEIMYKMPGDKYVARLI